MLLPALVSTAPLAAWLLLHNYLGFGTLFGPRAYGEMWPLENISLSLTKMLHWFLPYTPGLKQLLLRPGSILLPLAVLLFVLNRRHAQRWGAAWRALLGIYAWPALLFSIVYYFLLAFTVNTIDHRDLTSDRYYILLLPVLMVFLLLLWQHLVAPSLEQSRPLQLASLALVLAWLIYPLFGLQEYLRLSLVNGEPSNYNIYNSRHFTELPVLKEGRRLAAAHPDAVLYSNYVNLLWFQYKRPVHTLLPADQDLDQAARVASLKRDYAGWPGAEDGYIIWFLPNEYKYLAGPEDLSHVANLELLYHDKDGEIYRVTAR
jgi:hypothetical protein